MNEYMIPPCFYRVSTKALIFKDNKILLIMEPDGRWELPGGGLEVGETFESGLRREIKEEIGVNVTYVETNPSHVWSLVVDDGQKGIIPKLILLFVVKVDSLNFTGNKEESVKFEFFSLEELKSLNLHPNIRPLAGLPEL